MHIGRFRPWAATLRTRLMLWNTVVVVVTTVVILYGVREGVRITSMRELDRVLEEDTTEISLSLREFGNADSQALHEQLARKSQGHAHHKWFAQLFDEQGNLLYATANSPSQKTLGPPQINPQPRTIDTWRVITRRTNQKPGGLVRVGASVNMIAEDMDRVDRQVLLAGGLILLIGPPCGYWLAGRATRPFANMIATMVRLRPSELHDRLPLRGAGDELDRLSAAFNNLLDRIRAYLDEHRDFLANASHELRTPLAAIRSTIEVALAGDRTREEYMDLLSSILNESSSLELLVNQLLLLAETDAERLMFHCEPVRLDQMVEQAADMFRGVAESRDVELTCPRLPRVEIEGNRQHLRQVVYNLLDNAIKFTPTGGKVRIDVRLDEAARVAVLRVADTGQGIPPEDVPQVFGRFYRGDKARRREGETRGTGLGLSICHAIVTAHEGTIQVESKVGQGTTVVVRLPVSRDADDQHAAGAAKRPSENEAPRLDGQAHPVSSPGAPLQESHGA